LQLTLPAGVVFQLQLCHLVDRKDCYIFYDFRVALFLDVG
jgi:hypothetical protein